jgi:hypothetical protein
VTLHLKSTAKAAKFEYTDGSMDVSWTVDASLEDDELVERLRRIVAFYDAQTGREALPERIPGMALGMAQTQYPPMEPVIDVGPAPAMGWAQHAGSVSAPPAVPEGAEFELIPPEEQ